MRDPTRIWHYKKLINKYDDAGIPLPSPRKAMEISNGYFTVTLTEDILLRCLGFLNMSKDDTIVKSPSLLEGSDWQYVNVTDD